MSENQSEALPPFETPSKLETPSEAFSSGIVSRRRFVALAAAGVTSGFWLRGGAPVQAAPRETVATLGSTDQSTSVSPASRRMAFHNRAPLQDVPFTALPLGSIKARGWLLHQMELQSEGLTGNAEKLLPAVNKNSAWRGGNGEDWEKGPYYLKGLIALAYTTDNEAFKAKAQEWLKPILASQRPDGFYGPKNDDWWPRMVVNYLLRDYAEASNDARVEPFLTNYYRYMVANLPERPLRDWGKARAGDEIDTIFWLYNRTGEDSLLKLADLLYQQAYAWSDIFTHDQFFEFGADFHPKHAVNVPQALKLPPVYWQRSKSAADRTAFNDGVANLMRDHGLAVGINSGTEFLAGRSTTQGIEVCSIVERMLSDETAIRILGDPAIGDNLEMLAFNALPAALSKDYHQHIYFTLPNNVTAPHGGLGFTQNYDNGRTPSPISGYPCCCYNFHMGWPKLAQNSWASTKDGGLAFVAYVPSQVTAPVAGGKTATFTAETNYPFDESIRLTFESESSAHFPLSLRIPAWCDEAILTVNGKAQAAPKSGTFAVLNRTWKSGDEVVLKLPMPIQTHTGVNNSVIVQRGPLLYTLQIAEEWKARGETKVPGFETYEVTPKSDWNYALIVDQERPDHSFDVEHREIGANPFVKEQTPIVLRARAQKLPQWTLAHHGRSAIEPPVSPVQSSAPIEMISLVPFGSQMLRITNFPVVGENSLVSNSFRDRFAQGHFDDWILYGGGWLVRDAAFGPSADVQTSHAVATQARFDNFTYEAEVATGESGDAGLTFRVNRVAIGDDAYTGYYLGLSAQKGTVVLGRVDDVFAPIKVVDKALAPHTFIPVRVEAKGGHFKVWIGDLSQPLFEAEDATFREGAIGVRQYGGKKDAPQEAEFRRIVVQKLA